MYNLEGIARDSLEGIHDYADWIEEISFLGEKGAEGLQDLLDQVHSVLNSLQTAPAAGHIILVTHGAVVLTVSSFYGDRSPVKTGEARVFPFPKILN